MAMSLDMGAVGVAGPGWLWDGRYTMSAKVRSVLRN
jgi:hypothetical protein